MAIDDLEAINRYMTSTPIKTSDAAELHDDWIKWWDTLSWTDKHFEDTYDEARNRRNAFNMANAVTPRARSAAEDTIKNGLSTEELAGGTDRRLSTGEYSEDFVSPGLKYEIAKVGGILAAGWLLKTVIFRAVGIR